MTKEERKAKQAQRKAEGKGLVQEFKAFIARGNVLDMAVGVIIGGAFNAIVTAFVNILMSVCTWRIPGGIKGLATPLKAANDVQKGLNPDAGLVQWFYSFEIQDKAEKLARANYSNFDSLGDAAQVGAISEAKSTILGKYTLHGVKYYYNLSAVIDWGAFINAVISFLIIAITLFVIVKVAAKSAKMREEIKAKALKKEEAPAEEAPAAE